MLREVREDGGEPLGVGDVALEGGLARERARRGFGAVGAKVLRSGLQRRDDLVAQRARGLELAAIELLERDAEVVEAAQPEAVVRDGVLA